jgi:C-terminal processing protease CtpA/Prc
MPLIDEGYHLWCRFLILTRQVGLMLKGTIIDQLVVGGPAYNSGDLDRGDFVEAVDGTPVDQDSILKTLIGLDTPGSMVTLTVRKGGLVGKRVIAHV